MPLERELKVVQDYMYLQQMRFGQRIRYDTDCNQDTLEVLVPSFALQPLVKMPSSGISPKGLGKDTCPFWMGGKADLDIGG